MEQFPVALSSEAVTRLAAWIKRKPELGQIVRVGVKGGGCSGLEYVLRLEHDKKPTDLVWERDGLVVVCDPKSAKVLQGATLEWTGNLAGAFRFDNPNADRSCGCGTSFTLKEK